MQDRGVEPCISLEAIVEISAEAVVAIQLGKKLVDAALAEADDDRDKALPSQASARRVLRRSGGSVICRVAVACVFEMRRLCPEAAFSFLAGRPCAGMRVTPARRSHRRGLGGGLGAVVQPEGA